MSVWTADVYLNSDVRQDVCPFGKAFCTRKDSAKADASTLSLCGAQHCKFLQHVGVRSDVLMNRRDIVNLRYSGGSVHIALSA